MKKSIITQKIIAKAFKDLMQSNAYHQISVSDIMQTAKIRRQTFYNYFQNQEELLSWIFENDFAELINDNSDYYGWQNELLLLLRYLDENQIFYQKIFVIDKNFEHFFLIQWENLLDKVLLDPSAPQTRPSRPQRLSRMVISRWTSCTLALYSWIFLMIISGSSLTMK